MTYQNMLNVQFSARLRANPHYSLRAFARDVGLTPAHLSQVLNGKKGLSQQSATLISKRLGLSKVETSSFCDLVQASDGRSKKIRDSARKRLQGNQALQGEVVDSELFKIVGDWYHFAILELCQVNAFSSDPKWISKRLGIHLFEAREGITRLIKAGLLSKDKDNQLRPSTSVSHVLSGPPSEAIRQFHRHILGMASQALILQNVDDREFFTSLFAFDRCHMAEAKLTLRKFGKEFSERFPNSGDSVFALSLQFFRIDQQTRERKNVQLINNGEKT